MYKVMLVDDETWSLESLKSSVNWDDIGLNLHSTYKSSSNALSALSLDKPDLLITDINMPKITGIQLLKHAKKINPEIEVLVVSGHRDFTYAREALSYGASGYILKPFNRRDIEENLTSIKSRIENRKSSKFKELVLEKSPTLISFLAKYNIILDGLNNYRLIISNIKISNDKSFPYLDDTYISIIPQNHLIKFKKGYKYGVVSNLKYSKDLFPCIYAAKNLYLNYFISCDETFFKRDLRHIKYKKEFSKELIILIENKERERVESYLKMLPNLILSNDGDINDVLNFYNSIRSFITIRSNVNLESFNSPKQLIEYYKTWENFITDLKQAIRGLTSVPSMLNPRDFDSYISSQTIKTINSNFKKQVNIKKLAEFFSTSPSYLSQVFKKETGQTIIGYITSLRMDEAKDLLISTRETVAKISEMVGYQDYFYFTKIFKKSWGVTPSKYRKDLL